MLDIRELSYAYDARTVLHRISCHITQGEFVGLIGPNGAGKSTLIKLIDAILVPPENTIFLNDRPLSSLSRKALARQLAYVPQEIEVTFAYSVKEVVRMGRYPHMSGIGYLSEKDNRVVLDSMDLMDVRRFSERHFNELSGGERQRVIIASALAQEPAMILLDEPTSALDLHHQIEIYQLLRKEQQQNKLTVMVITHDINLAAQFCDRLILLHEGKIIRDGSPNDVLQFKLLQDVFGVNVYIDINPLTNSIYILPYAKKE